MFSAYWRLVRNHDVIVISSGSIPIFFYLDNVHRVLRNQIFAINCIFVVRKVILRMHAESALDSVSEPTHSLLTRIRFFVPILRIGASPVITVVTSLRITAYSPSSVIIASPVAIIASWVS